MELELLAKYKSWADDLLYNCISGLTESELKKNRAMLFGNILGLLHHVYAMDIVWKSHLQGVPHNFKKRNPEFTISFPELYKQQAEINKWFETYCMNLSEEMQTENVSFSFIGGGAGNMSRYAIVQHLVNHSSYHRGHIEGVLYQMSIEPPTTDMPVYLQTINV